MPRNREFSHNEVRDNEVSDKEVSDREVRSKDFSLGDPLESSSASSIGGSSEWIERMYSELHEMASAYMRNEQNTVSLSPTVLIHELYLRLPGKEHQQLSQTHFFALAATTMRRALVDQARFRRRKKRGGDYSRQQLVDWEAISPANSDHVLAVDEALSELEALDPRQAKIVELRFFAGMTVAEVAETLQVSKRTVESDWTMVKAWLRRWFDEEPKSNENDQSDG